MLWSIFLVCSQAPGTALAAQQPPGPERGREERSQAVEERRILTLADGRKLRAIARARGEGWEVRDGNVWLVLPAGLVQGVESEREVLARLHELSARVPPEDLNRRCALAEWMLQQGLLAEALSALDQLLGADPEHAGARALIARSAIPVAYPHNAEDADLAPRERIDTLLRFGAQSRPALRELVVAKLDALHEPGILREALVRETQSGVVTRREFGLLGLRRSFPGAAVRELLACATYDPSADVRAESALGLRLVDARSRLVPLVHVLARDEPAARMHAAEALGMIGDAAALEPLVMHLARLVPPQTASSGGAPRSHIFVGNQVGYLRDFDVQIAQGASIADPVPDIASEGTQLDVKVVGIGVESATPAAERRTVCRALARISGEKPSEDPERWFAWWKQHNEGAPPKADVPR